MLFSSSYLRAAVILRVCAPTISIRKREMCDVESSRCRLPGALVLANASGSGDLYAEPLNTPSVVSFNDLASRKQLATLTHF